jgi:hypothetical protein
MDTLVHFLDNLGVWGLILSAVVFIAYLGERRKTESARLNAALRRRWVMATWVVTALLAWSVTWFRVARGDAYMLGSGRLPWLPAALIACVLASAAVALSATKYWPRWRPWPTLLIALVMILGSKSARGAAPENELKQGAYGDEIAFVQERLKSLHCFEDEDKPRLREFDNPTAGAVIRFQQANRLLSDPGRDFHNAGVVRREREFRKLANPFADVKPCSP